MYLLTVAHVYDESTIGPYTIQSHTGLSFFHQKGLLRSKRKRKRKSKEQVLK